MDICIALIPSIHGHMLFPHLPRLTFMGGENATGLQEQSLPCGWQQDNADVPGCTARCLLLGNDHMAVAEQHYNRYCQWQRSYDEKSLAVKV